MLIRFTDKLSKKLKIGPLTKVVDDPGRYLEWYAHLFTANRYQYILVTEASSLFSIVMYGKGINHDGKFIEQLIDQLREYLEETENQVIFDRIIAPTLGAIMISKTSSKKVLGSMNDMVSLSKRVLEDEETIPWDLANFINRTPFKAIAYKTPTKAFREMNL